MEIKIKNDYALINGEMYHKVCINPENITVCPFCGSDNLVIDKKNDATFFPRTGCTNCNIWFGPPRLRREG